MKYTLLTLFLLGGCATLGHRHEASDYELEKSSIEYAVFDRLEECKKNKPYKCAGYYLIPEEAHDAAFCEPMPETVAVECSNRFVKGTWACTITLADAFATRALVRDGDLSTICIP